MPLKGGKGLGDAGKKWVCNPSRCQLHLLAPLFAITVGRYPPAKDVGKELATKADTKQGNLLRYDLGHEPLEVEEKGETLPIMDPHGTAKDNEVRELPGLRQGVAGMEPHQPVRQ
jgi:hypothetical protein